MPKINVNVIKWNPENSWTPVGRETDHEPLFSLKPLDASLFEVIVISVI